MNFPRPKAIALISGGLDSALAAYLVKSWGIEVIGLHLVSPFGCELEVQKVASELNIPLLFREKGAPFIDLVESPKYGYGSQINPCIDCRIYMFEAAQKVLEETLADFIVTGEVVGQRPLSQTKAAIDLIERKSPLEHKILRPLSGGNLPPTFPEEQGWIQRDKLLKFSGRGRSEQLALAKQFGLSEHSSPGGGCLLTEAAFSDRLRDFYAHPSYHSPSQKMAQARVLQLGRHFRLSKSWKVVVARTEKETQTFREQWKSLGASFYEPSNFHGPVALGFGELSQEHRLHVASLVARYGKKTNSEPFSVDCHELSETQQMISRTVKILTPPTDETLNPWRIGIT
jgi:tRNA-uridine 2-sulfurtransferase